VEGRQEDEVVNVCLCCCLCVLTFHLLLFFPSLQIKAQAEVIANAEGGNNPDKLRQIEKLFHQKSLKKEKKERVYVVTLKNGKTVTPKTSSGRKGKVVKVDSRQKKDKRGEKKAAQRSKKAKSNKNKKQRKL
jgi:hypothetical protein